MKLSMLVVDKDIAVSQVQQAEWLKHGINTVRVDSMQEAIEKLTTEVFLFSVINADNIHYLPLLKVMRDTAPSIIIIIITNHTTEKEVEALHNGADVFTKFNQNVELNVQLALAQLLRCKERDKPPQKLSHMILYEKFLVLPDSRSVFYGDERLILTKKEYDILHYLIINHDVALTYEMIYNSVWGEYDSIAGHKTLWDYILKVRNKLRGVTGDKEYIITMRDTGYFFSSNRDKLM